MLRRQDGRRLVDNLGIKRAGAAGENRMIKGFRPMEQVFGVSEAHLGVLATRVREKIHPILPLIFLGTIAPDFVISHSTAL